MSLQIWTPRQGASGLIIIPKPTPILIVTGGRVHSWTPQQTRATEPSATVELHRTTGGILYVKQRSAKPRRIIGHPELAMGATVRKDDTLYVSISEAIYRQHQGEDVELHFTSTSEDDNTDFVVFLNEELQNISDKLNSAHKVAEVKEDKEILSKLVEIKKKFVEIKKEEVDEKYLQKLLKYQKLVHELEN